MIATRYASGTVCLSPSREQSRTSLLGNLRRQKVSPDRSVEDDRPNYIVGSSWCQTCINEPARQTRLCSRSCLELDSDRCMLRPFARTGHITESRMISLATSFVGRALQLTDNDKLTVLCSLSALNLLTALLCIVCVWQLTKEEEISLSNYQIQTNIYKDLSD